MFEQPPVVQMQIEFSVGLVSRVCVRKREQPGFAIREGKLLCKKQRLICSIRRNRPLERLESFEPLICNAGEQRCQRSDLAINFGGMLILPIRSETIGNVLDDSPVWPAAFQGFEHFIEPLDSPFRACKGAFFFKAWARR